MALQDIAIKYEMNALKRHTTYTVTTPYKTEIIGQDRGETTGKQNIMKNKCQAGS